MKPLIQQFYEAKAAQEQLDRHLSRLKRRLEKRVIPGATLDAGVFHLRVTERAEVAVPAHVRKPCKVWEAWVE